MLKEFITNPVILGLVAGSIVYAYLSWTRKKYNEKRLKKGKKIKDADKYDEIIIPILVAVLVWFIAIGYINYKTNPNQQIQNQQLPPTMNPGYKLVVDQPSELHNSFTLVRNGISLPSANQPNVLMQQKQETMVGPAQPSMPLFGGNNQQNQQNQILQQNQQNQTINTRSQNNNIMNPNLINPTNNNMNIPDIFTY
jgi:hypothetical protein